MSEPHRTRDDMSDAPLDPLALAWYRHRIASGCCDAEALDEHLLDRLTRAAQETPVAERPAGSELPPPSDSG